MLFTLTFPNKLLDFTVNRKIVIYFQSNMLIYPIKARVYVCVCVVCGR